MAGRTDMIVDDEAPLLARLIEGSEDPVERPVDGGRRRRLAGGEDRPRRQQDGEARGERPAAQTLEEPSGHHAFSMGRAEGAPAATVPPPRRTGSLMLTGNGRGRSSLPSNGMMTRKCRK